MLRDRKYEIGDAEIEETYEEFEKWYLTKPQMNFIAKRPVPGVPGMETDLPMMEPIYVVFATKEEKLSKDAINKVVNFMHQYSQDNKHPNTQELLNAILIVKGGSTPIAKKVSRVYLTFVECRCLQPLCYWNVPARRVACQHHLPRAGTKALSALGYWESRTVEEIQSERIPAT